MRTTLFKVCLVLVACTAVLAPRAQATGEQDRYVGQWRLFPRAPFAKPADEQIASRFTRQVDPLVALFRKNGEVPGALGDALIEIDARHQLFRLESLLRLYTREFPELDKYRLVVKEIEDSLGNYSFAVDAMKFAKDKFKEENQAGTVDAARKAEQDKILAALDKKKAAARLRFERDADQSAFATELPQLPAFVHATLAGWSASKDWNYVNSELQRTLKTVRERHFNFNLLEDGIHEFRRQLRWFPMAIDSLDGLVMLRDDAPGECPVPGLEALKGTRAARNRYANPSQSNPAAHPCSISRCLMWQVAKTVDDIGKLKDEVQGQASVDAAFQPIEFDVAGSNKVTKDEIVRATASRDELFKSKALDILSNQLNSCKF